MSEIKLYEDGPIRNGLPTTTHTGDNIQYIGKHNSQLNGKSKMCNRHDILLGQRQNPKKPFTRILGRGKEKPGRLCHQTPPNMAP